MINGGDTVEEEDIVIVFTWKLRRSITIPIGCHTTSHRNVKMTKPYRWKQI